MPLTDGTGEAFGPTFSTGDVVGCGIDWTSVKIPGEDTTNSKQQSGPGPTEPGAGRAFFTKNGEFVGYAFGNLAPTELLYPTVGLRTPGEQIRANFGQRPFRFDIASFARERQRLLLAELDQKPLPPRLQLPPAPQPTAIPALFSFPSSESQAQAAMRETVLELIAQYLAHEGYTDSAASLNAQRNEERYERVRGLVPLEDVKIKQEDENEEDEHEGGSARRADAAARGEIRALIGSGDAEGALQRLEQAFPAVLSGDEKAPGGGTRFKLRVRAFIEAAHVYALEEMRSKKAQQEADQARASASQEHDQDDQSVDMDTTENGPAPTPAVGSSDAYDHMMLLSAGLREAYGKDDPSPAVKKQLQVAHGVMGFTDESNDPEVARLLSPAAREELADEVNAAILGECA